MILTSLLVGGLIVLPAAPDEPQDDAPRIEVLNDFDVGMARSAADGRPVLLVFAAVWCSSCRRFISETLPDPRTQALGESVHWVKVEVDREVSLARRFGVVATPTFVLVGSDGATLGEARGVLTPQELVTFVEMASSVTDPGSPLNRRAEDLTPLTLTPRGYRGKAVCFSHVGYGPLKLPSQAPGQVLRHGLLPRTPSTLANGQWELDWHESLANVWAVKDGSYFLDYATLNSTLSMAYGLSDTWLVEFEAQDVRRFNSILDPITIAFHDLFGLDQNGRDEHARNEDIIFIEGRDGVDTIDIDESGTEVQSLAFTLQNNVTCGTRNLPAIAWAATVRGTVGGRAKDEPGSSISFGLSASASRRFGVEHYLYLSLGHVWHGQDSYLGLELEDQQTSLLLAWEWRGETSSASSSRRRTSRRSSRCRRAANSKWWESQTPAFTITIAPESISAWRRLSGLSVYRRGRRAPSRRALNVASGSRRWRARSRRNWATSSTSTIWCA